MAIRPPPCTSASAVMFVLVHSLESGSTWGPGWDGGREGGRQVVQYSVHDTFVRCRSPTVVQCQRDFVFVLQRRDD